MKATVDVPVVTMTEIAERVRQARVELDWREFEEAQREKQAIRERTERRIARINSGTLRGKLLMIFTRGASVPDCRTERSSLLAGSDSRIAGPIDPRVLRRATEIL